MAEIYEDFVEIYHQRMAGIQDVSDVIAVANMQLNKMLTKLGWSRQSLTKENKLEKCPIDENHETRGDNLNSHIQICNIRKHNIISMENKDLPVSPLYDGEGSSVVPIFISTEQYRKMGISMDNDLLNSTQSITDFKESDNDLLEQDEGINDYIPCNSLDELRFIYSWHKIPKKYFVLDITNIPKLQLSTWLQENLSQAGLNEDCNIYLTNSIICWLNDLPMPTQLSDYIQDVLKDETKHFVLRLWKFLAAKCLCLNQQIPEHTRNEFDFYATTSMTNQVATVRKKNNTEGSNRIEIMCPFIPMEWVYSKLSIEQKLSIYNDVCKSSKLLKSPSFGFSELESETQNQIKFLSEFEGNSKGQKSYMEVLAELRDYKRRRQSYRGKNKVTKKMSAISVLRELFEQQMLYFKLLQENKRRQEEEEETKKITELSNSRSPSPNRSSKSSSRDRKTEQQNKYTKVRERNESKSRDSRRDRSRSRDRYRSSNSERYRGSSKDREQRREYRDSRHERSRYRDKKEVSNITYYDDDKNIKEEKS